MFLLAVIAPSILIPLAAGGAAVAGVWLLLESITGKKPRLDERLDEVRDPSLRRRKEAGPQGATEAMRGVLEKATPALAKPLQPQNEHDASKLKTKLAHAGFRSEGAANAYLGLKIIALGTGVVVAGGGLFVFGMGMQVILRTAMFACGMFFLPDVILFLLASKRKEGIFLGLPDALDLMVVCVEAGLGLDQAMRKVARDEEIVPRDRGRVRSLQSATPDGTNTGRGSSGAWQPQRRRGSQATCIDFDPS